MKILVLTPGIFPDSHSGISKIVFYTARELKKRGHEIIVLTRQYNPSQPVYEVVEEMHYHRFYVPKRGNIFYRLWPLFLPIQSLIMQRKISQEHQDIDIIWVHNLFLIILGNTKKLWPRSRLVYQMVYRPSSEIISNHGSGLIFRLFGYIYDFLMICVMKHKVDLVSVISQFVFQQCLSMLGAKYSEKLKIITPGVDPEVFYPVSAEERKNIRKNLGMDFNCTSFITARGLKGRTGVDKLIEAALLLKQHGIDYSLIIVGKGPMKRKLEDKIATSGLNAHVKILSNLTEEELAKYYQACDVFVLPTQGGEGFGLATAEALASGLVSLGTDNGGTTEILEKFNPRWLIKGTDEKHIFEKMYEFCKNPEQFSLPSEHIRRITIKNYTWEVGAMDFLDIANELRG